MSRTVNEFSYEALQDTEMVIAHLQALIDGLSNGKLTLSSNGEALLLHPHGLLKFALKAKRSSHRARLVLKLSWTDGKPAVAAEPAPLTIRPSTS